MNIWMVHVVQVLCLVYMTLLKMSVVRGVRYIGEVCDMYLWAAWEVSG